MSAGLLAIAYVEATLRSAPLVLEAPDATSEQWFAFLCFRAAYRRLMATRARARGRS